MALHFRVMRHDQAKRSQTRAREPSVVDVNLDSLPCSQLHYLLASSRTLTALLLVGASARLGYPVCLLCTPYSGMYRAHAGVVPTRTT